MCVKNKKKNETEFFMCYAHSRLKSEREQSFSLFGLRLINRGSVEIAAASYRSERVYCDTLGSLSLFFFFLFFSYPLSYFLFLYFPLCPVAPLPPTKSCDKSRPQQQFLGVAQAKNGEYI